jgi:hypothetical protein
MAVTHNDALTRDLLVWISAKPRTYGETMEAWRTSCPRLSVWEDAVVASLVCVRASNGGVTAQGRTLLARHGVS